MTDDDAKTLANLKRMIDDFMMRDGCCGIVSQLEDAAELIERLILRWPKNGECNRPKVVGKYGVRFKDPSVRVMGLEGRGWWVENVDEEWLQKVDYLEREGLLTGDVEYTGLIAEPLEPD